MHHHTTPIQRQALNGRTQGEIPRAAHCDERCPRWGPGALFRSRGFTETLSTILGFLLVTTL